MAAGASGASVVLARGEHDAPVSQADLATLVDDPVTLPRLGHNPQVEDPHAVVALLDRLTPRRRSSS